MEPVSYDQPTHECARCGAPIAHHPALGWRAPTAPTVADRVWCELAPNDLGDESRHVRHEPAD